MKLSLYSAFSYLHIILLQDKNIFFYLHHNAPSNTGKEKEKGRRLQCDEVSGRGGEAI